MKSKIDNASKIGLSVDGQIIDWKTSEWTLENSLFSFKNLSIGPFAG